MEPSQHLHKHFHSLLALSLFCTQHFYSWWMEICILINTYAKIHFPIFVPHPSRQSESYHSEIEIAKNSISKITSASKTQMWFLFADLHSNLNQSRYSHAHTVWHTYTGAFMPISFTRFHISAYYFAVLGMHYKIGKSNQLDDKGSSQECPPSSWWRINGIFENLMAFHGFKMKMPCKYWHECQYRFA